MEFFNSLFKSVNERLTSPLYWALLIATVIWNYDIFLTIFFVDNEAILKVTWDKLMKATYIHDVLFTTFFWRNLLECMHPLLAYFTAGLWRLIPVIGLTWIFIMQLPKIANKAHEEERKFMQEREKKNIDYEENIADYKYWKLLKIQNALKIELDNERARETISNLRKSNNERISEVSKIDNKNIDITRLDLDEYDLEQYKIIISNPEILARFKVMLGFINTANKDKKSVKKELWLKYKDYEKFEEFSSNDLIEFNIFTPLWEKDSKYYLYFTDLWMKISLQLVRDGYLQQDDLAWKI